MNWLPVGLLTMVMAIPAMAQADAAMNLNDRGNRAADQGSHAEAQSLYREAIRIWRSLGVAYEAHLAGTLMNLGVSLCGDGMRPAGAKVYEEALALHRRSLGTKHHRTVANMNLLASDYLMLADTDSAQTLFEEALPIERELYPHDIQTARTLEGLSNVLMRQGKADVAIPLAEEALTITLKEAGEDSLDAALAFSTVAEVHRSGGRPERALPLFRKARAIYEKSLGPEHPRVASIQSQEGLILMDEGKLALAEQSMAQSLRALASTCAACVVEQAIAENNLALLRLKQKRYAEADRLLSHVLQLREQFTAQPGREVAEALQSLAYAREKQRLYQDAARLQTRAAAILGYR
jgi:tetratricopeptide (TPR) repeat protein